MEDSHFLDIDNDSVSVVRHPKTGSTNPERLNPKSAYRELLGSPPILCQRTYHVDAEGYQGKDKNQDR